MLRNSSRDNGSDVEPPDIFTLNKRNNPFVTLFANHTAGESVTGKAVRGQIASIFKTWPDINFKARRLYVAKGLIVQEWTATATHKNTMHRGDLVASPTGKKITWEGVDIIPFKNGLIKRKDVYSDSVTILRAVGLL